MPRSHDLVHKSSDFALQARRRCQTGAPSVSESTTANSAAPSRLHPRREPILKCFILKTTGGIWGQNEQHVEMPSERAAAGRGQGCPQTASPQWSRPLGQTHQELSLRSGPPRFKLVIKLDPNGRRVSHGHGSCCRREQTALSEPSEVLLGNSGDWHWKGRHAPRWLWVLSSS